MKLFLHPFDLQLKYTFQTSNKSINSQPTLIVELQQDGKSGYGEATANPYYGVTIEGLISALEGIRSLIESYSFGSPEDLWDLVHLKLSNDYFALCALDVAANDLFGKQKNIHLYKLWGLNLNNLPLTNFTIGIAPIETMVEKLIETPWPLYKIKLGTKEDVEIVRELRKHTNSIFRVDANGGWGVQEAIDNSVHLKELGVEFIEQPLNAEDWEGMKKLKQESLLPCIADESCRREEDVLLCSQHFHGINIKLMKCGGLTPALRMIREGRALGIKIMAGCMTESSVGISAIAHLLPMLDYVDMDGALLLSNDIAKGVRIEHGEIKFPPTPGTGVTLPSRLS